jgi:hypothetical protein
MIRSSAHWRQCANKCRLLADQSSDPLISNTILDIALSYERLAIHAEVAITLGKRQTRNSRSVADSDNTGIRAWAESAQGGAPTPLRTSQRRRTPKQYAVA